ncbi:Uu.00g098550.m01.CDS01 [Anthostomella pinea]|uniref:Uu.00g098550.m01.CDS01 n=1 Tax=Anthostomella pinea TaxID=933095 RepID=A0AAI8VCP4_9PEZI|nr:Uu.00g098550.m01.CDS01 [Anthostomella pinea]
MWVALHHHQHQNKPTQPPLCVRAPFILTSSVHPIIQQKIHTLNAALSPANAWRKRDTKTYKTTSRIEAIHLPGSRDRAHDSAVYADCGWGHNRFRPWNSGRALGLSGLGGQGDIARRRAALQPSGFFWDCLRRKTRRAKKKSAKPRAKASAKINGNGSANASASASTNINGTANATADASSYMMMIPLGGNAHPEDKDKKDHYCRECVFRDCTVRILVDVVKECERKAKKAKIAYNH